MIKTKTKLTILSSALCLSLAFASCGSDDDVKPEERDCLSEKVTLTETSVNDLTSVHAVQVDFDAKNTSDQNLDISRGTKAIYAELKITMTDGTVYTEEQPMLAELGAGQTKVVTLSCDYAAGKTFQSYTVKTYCKDF